MVSEFPPGSGLFSPHPATVAADLLPRSRPAWRVFRPSPASVQVIPPRCSRRLLLRQPGLEPPPGPVASPDLGALVRAGGHGESGPGASAQTVAAGAMDRAPADQVGLGGSPRCLWGSGGAPAPQLLRALLQMLLQAPGVASCNAHLHPQALDPQGRALLHPLFAWHGPKGVPKISRLSTLGPQERSGRAGRPQPDSELARPIPCWLSKRQDVGGRFWHPPQRFTHPRRRMLGQHR